MRLLQNPDCGDVTPSAMTVEVSSQNSEAARIQELLGEVASLQEDKVGAPVLSAASLWSGRPAEGPRVCSKQAKYTPAPAVSTCASAVLSISPPQTVP